jgi:predicted HTH domain antitoxin
MVVEDRKMKGLQLYEENKVSLGLAAKFADLSLSEFLDLLEKHNIKMNQTLDDAKEAMNNSELL